MIYSSKEEFERANMFGQGVPTVIIKVCDTFSITIFFDIVMEEK